MGTRWERPVFLQRMVMFLLMKIRISGFGGKCSDFGETQPPVKVNKALNGRRSGIFSPFLKKIGKKHRE